LSCGDSPDPDEAQEVVQNELKRLLSCLSQRRATAIVISGEVGLGLVPESPLGRLYRDLLGWANQVVAKQADATYLMVAGLAVDIRSLATTVVEAASQCSLSQDDSSNR
jgi:adenosylcobinamide kinase/adenosylcobinamide-phosphate guanylyltransferase